MQTNFKKTPFFLSVVFFTFLLLAFLFLYREINSNNKKAEERMVELEDEVNRRQEIKSLNLSIETIKKEKALLETHFAKSSDIVPFLGTIEGLAPKAGVEAEIASVDILKDNTGLMVQINTSGSFESLYKFLTLLENSPYELEFIGMDMQKEGGGGEGELPSESVKFQASKWQAIFRIKLLSFIP